MKKLLVVLGVVAFGFAFTSCKKECTCKANGINMPTSGIIESKEDCDAFAELSKDIPGFKCEWK